ncbi:MAG TPA: TlyA family RNA methyltransferase [Xanthobacteraceae bacterium]|jgi:23S rRNA (cytidine1920-2'-O)/16S rRNA (cytidine1409-2'-O)-methyltransferase|nr:TlyA family RNA methyltransferase [Xanthobacteraceae bacterium]
MTSRERADRLLVARGLFESRARAQAAITAGLVTADGVVVRKPSEEISSTADIEATPEHPYVSRGGVKLAAALDHFGVDVKDRVCLDVGASTGGFTEVLLARGARLVYAVDVGSGQLHPRLRDRADVQSFEQTDIRKFEPSRLSQTSDIATIDVSFISLKLVLPAMAHLLTSKAQIVALIKPQFETQRGSIKKGIVRDEAVHKAVCDDITSFFSLTEWAVSGIIPSPIFGGDGNREFLIEAKRG